jgi:hypothetical protein
MRIEAIAILYLGVGFLLVVLFCKALEIIVERAATLFVGKKKDPIDLLRIELGAIKTEIMPVVTELQAISTKMKIELEAIATQITELRGRVSISPSQVAQADTWQRGNSESQPLQGYASSANDQNQEATRDKPEDDTSIVPTIDQSIERDTWTRDVDKSDSVANTKGAIADVVTAEIHQAANPKEIAPKCTKCGNPMLLKRLHPGRFAHYKGDFECETCGRSTKEVVTIASGDSHAPV